MWLKSIVMKFQLMALSYWITNTLLNEQKVEQCNAIAIWPLCHWGEIFSRPVVFWVIFISPIQNPLHKDGKVSVLTAVCVTVITVTAEIA